MNINIDLTEFGGVITALLVVGAILKNAFPKFPNRAIPAITWILGVLAYLTLAKGWGDPQQWLAAIVTAATATGLHSGIKNTVQSETVANVAKKTPLIFLIASLSLLTPGCAQLAALKPKPVAEGQDAIVVNAERAQVSSLEAYRVITEWEFNNRAILPVEVSRAVDQYREHFPDAWRESRKVLDDYKAKRGPNKDQVTRISAALSAAQSSLLQIKLGQSPEQIEAMGKALNQLTEAVKILTQ